MSSAEEFVEKRRFQFSNQEELQVNFSSSPTFIFFKFLLFPSPCPFFSFPFSLPLLLSYSPLFLFPFSFWRPKSWNWSKGVSGCRVVQLTQPSIQHSVALPSRCVFSSWHLPKVLIRKSAIRACSGASTLKDQNLGQEGGRAIAKQTTVIVWTAGEVQEGQKNRR